MKHKGKLTVGDDKFRTEANFTSAGELKLSIDHPRRIGNLKFRLTDEFTYDNATRQHENLFEASTKLKDLDLKYTFKADCAPGKVDITNHFIKKVSEGFLLSAYCTWDHQGRAWTDYGTGFWLENSFGQTGFTFKSVVGDSQGADFNFRQIVKVSKDTKVGVDYVFNCGADPAPELKIGLEHKAGKDTLVKAKINQSGWIEASVKTKLNKDWSVVGSTGLDSTFVNGKSDAVYGFGLEGKI